MSQSSKLVKSGQYRHGAPFIMRSRFTEKNYLEIAAAVKAIRKFYARLDKWGKAHPNEAISYEWNAAVRHLRCAVALIIRGVHRLGPEDMR